MTITPVALGSGSAQSKYGHAGSARFVNCYLEQQGENAKTPTVITACDGLTLFTTLDTLGLRAILECNGYLYAVYGRTLYRVAETGEVLTLGGIPTSGPVTMVRNRRDNPHIGVVSDGLFYVYDTADGSFTHVLGPSTVTNFKPTSIAMLDGYGILPVTNSVWYITEIDDLKTVDALEFAKAESNPDDIVRASTREGEVVLFGQRSTEFWQDTGDADFAFNRSQAIELGCLPGAGGSVVNVDRTIIWIAHDGTVRIMQGYDGKRISNHAVERAISSVDPSTISATTWWANGHTFYAVSSSVWTWVYDLATGQWHERVSGADKRWRVSAVARLGNDIIAGDYATGALYKMSQTAYAEAGEELVMTVQTPPVHAFPYRLAFNALHVGIVPGVGLADGSTEDVNPNLMVQWSDSGGKTWSAERLVSIGRQGDYLRRAVVRRLGVSSTHGRTFRLSVSAAVAKGLIEMAVDIDRIAA